MLGASEGREGPVSTSRGFAPALVCIRRAARAESQAVFFPRMSSGLPPGAPRTRPPAPHCLPSARDDGRGRRLPSRVLVPVLFHPHQRFGRVDAVSREPRARAAGEPTSDATRAPRLSPAPRRTPPPSEWPPQSQVRGILAALKVKTTDVDGANAENKTQRSEFWAISGKRAVYPQVFVQAKGETKFVGDGEDIVLANDDGILEGQLADAPRVEADA